MGQPRPGMALAFCHEFQQNQNVHPYARISRDGSDRGELHTPAVERIVKRKTEISGNRAWLPGNEITTFQVKQLTVYSQPPGMAVRLNNSQP